MHLNLGTASIAKGFSGYVDLLIDYQISAHLKEWVPLNIDGLSPYLDLFAFGITLVMAGNVD